MRATIFLLGVSTLALACAHTGEDSDEVTAAANLEARSGSTVAGRVEFSEARNGRVYVRVNATGLAASRAHGIHVHEDGDCSAADASSAGAHFNPTAGQHADVDDATKHIGDLGNVRSNAQGEIQDHYYAPGLTIRGENSIVGKAVVIHADPDDLKSQPSGNSGARIGCGVIAMAESVQ